MTSAAACCQLLTVLTGCLQCLAQDYSPEVVIVGGGVSGLAAANHLCRNKICNITILEAEDRVGGRLYTDRFHNEIIERGAQWMHGIKGNPVYSLVSDSYEVSPDDWSKDRGTTIFSSGAEATNVTRRLISMAEELVEDLYATLSAMERPESRINASIISEARTIWESKLRAHNISVARSMTDAIFHYTMTEWSLGTGEELNRVSALAVSEYRYFSGGDVAIPPGYSVLLDILQKDIPKSAIQLGRRVTKVVWRDQDNSTDSCKVSVEFTERNGSTGRIEADHVIVTMSIAVLQKYHRRMFIPNLPKQKSRAVERLRLGAVNKVFLYYEERFWDESSFPMRLLWDSDIEKELAQDAHWFREINVIQQHGNNTLLVWANAYVTRKFDDQTDEEIGRRLTALLRKSMRNESIPVPDDVVVTRWHKNDNFLGSYTYKSLGQAMLTTRKARKPLMVNGIPKVLFAGEAMHLNRYGTIDGAYRTGVKEAKRILRFNST